MMKKRIIFKSDRTGFSDSVYYYILLVAGISFLYMAFSSFTQTLYEHCLVIPCMLLLGALNERRTNLKDKKNLMLLSGAMVAWFLFLQLKRSLENTGSDNIGLFLSTYLFAFPFASLMQDGDKKKALKIFAGAYVAAAAVLATAGILLIFDCVPGFLSSEVYWNGGRLAVFWHPNKAACFLLIGIIFCTTFWSQVKSIWSKAVFFVLLIMMSVVLALTSCRTAIILTGGYLGTLFFFAMIQRGRKWFLPGVLVVLVLIVAFYEGAMCLYQANYDMLVKKYTQQYSEQIASELSDSSVSETEMAFEETAEPETTALPAETEPAAEYSAAEEVYDEEYYEEEYYEEEYYEEEYYEEDESADSQEEMLPIEVDPFTGEIHLTTDSPQGSISKDFGTLNARTYIWSAAKFAIRETPSILYWGMHNPGWYVSYYNFFPVAHLHNAWMQCLVGMGLVGLFIAMVFTLITFWNCLIILLKHYRDIWKRNVAILTLCLMVASILEPYLFYTTVDYHLTDFLFFLCAGYLVHWQEEDNRNILDKIRNRISFTK